MLKLINNANNELKENRAKYRFNRRISTKDLKPYDNKNYLKMVSFTLDLIRKKQSKLEGGGE